MTTDHLGSLRVITDQNGAVISRKDFAAFGDETLTVQRTQGLGYQPDNVRQDYTGYQKDDESGLEYAQARYYNSSHGRFTSVDPLTASGTIRNPQTFNRYTYALNSPYKFTDPLGLAPGFCAAEFANCDGETEQRPYGESEHDQRLQNTRDVNKGNAALKRGDQASAEAICASNPEISCTKATTTAATPMKFGRLIAGHRQVVREVYFGVLARGVSGIISDTTVATVVYSPVNTGTSSDGTLPAFPFPGDSGDPRTKLRWSNLAGHETLGRMRV